MCHHHEIETALHERLADDQRDEDDADEAEEPELEPVTPTADD